jgi:hypothetical protein
VRVHLVTVGDSILKHLEETRRQRAIERIWRSREATSRFSPHEPADVARLFELLATGDVNVVDTVEDMSAAAGMAEWRSTCSAETASLAAVTGRGEAGVEDAVILLSSDSGRGLLAAMWVALFMVGGVTGVARLRTLSETEPEPGAGAAILTPGLVHLARLPGLDLRGPDDPSLAMERLGDIGRQLVDAVDAVESDGDGHDVVVHLSGGYKATVPYVLCLAEGLRSARLHGGGRLALEAWLTHEDFVGDDHAPKKIPVPVRRMNWAIIQEDLRPFRDADSTTDDRRGKTLEGLAFEESGGRWVLTPFGRGLRRLVGFAQEP